VLADLLTLPITITRRTEGSSVDRYGNQVASTKSVETFGELQQEYRAEETLAGDIATDRWRLFLAPTEVLAAGDAVEANGSSFEVVGQPWIARNPRTGDEQHIEATLTRTKGVVSA